MFLHLPKKIAVGLMALSVTAMSLFIVSCQKELSGEGFNVTETPPDLTTKIAASVSGFVTDEADAPVQGATVQFGTSTASTDKYGYFEFSNVQAIKNAAVVTVLKPGYFKGIKTYIAAENKSGFFRIKLLPKTTQGNFDAAAGGTVTLTNGLSIVFPAAAIKLAAGGAYSGQVNVAAQWINPTAADLVKIMPGDLRGLDAQGFMRTLTTYGMAAVELTGSAGELLQIADGKKASMTFPIPSSLSGAAPADLPLWSFDETKGLWKQEGQAIKSGSNYVGEVSHFSFWNCDVPSNFVQFNCTIRDSDGSPIPFALVKVSVVGSQSSGYGYTDSSGYTGGAVPNNAQLLLEVFPYYGCGSPVFSQTFTTTNTTASLGVLTIPSSSISSAQVSGTVTNCANAPVTNGYVIMYSNNQYFRHPLNNGAFDFAYMLCNGTEQVSFIAEDIAGGEQSTSLSYTLNTGNNPVGNLQACGVTTEQFINYTQDGVVFTYTSPTDSFIMYSNTQSVPTSIYIFGTSMIAGGPNATTVSLAFTETGIAAGSTQQLLSFGSDSLQISAPIDVNITEYGAVGQFVAGNFTGTLLNPPPANTPTSVTCSFRVRRTR
ncbi:MAG: carboxypeptidase-like regulatory domain-containing protein [Bacteroidota bacterium]